MAERITIISAERIRDELVKLICGARPRVGVDLLVDTGLAEFVLPEVSALRLESDEHHRHKDVYQHSLQVLEQAQPWKPTPTARCRAPTSSCGSQHLCTTSASRLRAVRTGRRGQLPPPRHGGREAHDEADEGAALRQRHHQGRCTAGGAAHALLRIR